MLGSNCLPIHGFERSVYVSEWDSSYGSVECPNISGAITYDHTISRKVYMLVYHQSIHCARLSNKLMCKMQIWMSGLNINEPPKFLSEDIDEKTHDIIVNEPLYPNQPLIIPLVLKGITSYFPYRNPRASEYEDKSIPIDMPSEAPVWEPSEASFAEE